MTGRALTSMNRPGPRTLFRGVPIILLLLTISGCGLSLFSSSQASEGAHAVVLTRPGCSTFIARTLNTGFLLATAQDGTYTPAPGDVFDGPVREGRSFFLLYPTNDQTTREGGINLPLEVLAVNLDLAEARGRLDVACGPGR